jgi:hypothetical protein
MSSDLSLLTPLTSTYPLKNISAMRWTDFDVLPPEKNSTSFISLGSMGGRTGFFPAADAQSLARRICSTILAAVMSARALELLPSRQMADSFWIDPTQLLQLAKAFRSGKIAISADLLKPREKASESSIRAPSGYLLAWLEVDADGNGDVAF